MPQIMPMNWLLLLLFLSLSVFCILMFNSGIYPKKARIFSMKVVLKKMPW